MTLTVDIPRNASAPARARATLREMDAAIDPALVSDIQLLISELVTNSVKYGGDDGSVRLEIVASTPGTVRVDVLDDGGAFIPIPRPASRTEAGGWGLQLVERLTDRWGVREGTTHVWFELHRD